MALLFYVRLVALTAGTLVYLFLLALILGHRRPRRFERLLFLLNLSLFALYAGGLLALNAQIQYSSPPDATRWFSQGLVAFGLVMIFPLVWHTHYAFRRQVRGSRPTVFARPMLIILYIGAAVELIAAIWIFWEIGHGAGIRLDSAMKTLVLVSGSSVPSIALMDTVFEFQDWRAAKDKTERGLFRGLFCVSGTLTILLALYKGVETAGSFQEQALTTTIVSVGILPGALLIYFALKHNFLEYGAQRNLVYALSATVLALLYLALVHRVSGWLAPVFPPEATASVLLFVLIFLFEPLERAIGPMLHRRFRERMSGLQNLTLDLQQEARHGDLARLISHAEQRIREEFGLAVVRISVPRDPSRKALESPGGLGHVVRMPLMKDHQEVGLLEAASTGFVPDRRDIRGAGVSRRAIAADGRSLPLDRRKSTAGARTGGARASRRAGADGGERFAQSAQSAQLDEDGFASAAREIRICRPICATIARWWWAKSTA